MSDFEAVPEGEAGQVPPPRPQKRRGLNDAGVRDIESRTRLGRATDKFYTWWGKQATDKLLSTATLKKSGIMGAAGLAVGVPAAAAGTVLLGPIVGATAGALAATKITKGVMAHHLSRRSQGAFHIDRSYHDLLKNIDARRNNIGGQIDSQVENEVHYNRRRLVAAAATAAGGALIGELAGNLLGIGGNNHTAARGESQGGTTTATTLAAEKSPVTQTSPAQPPSTSTSPASPPASGGRQGGVLSHPPGSRSTPSPDDRRTATVKDPAIRLTYSGDTLSDAVSDYLDEHSYNDGGDAINKVTFATLKRAHEDWNSAHNFQIGRRFRIPHEILEQIGKKK